MERFRALQSDQVTVDFSRVLHASPGGILPIVCILDVLRDSGVRVDIRLPRNQQVKSLFEYTRWASFLAGTAPHGLSGAIGKHSVLRRFEDANQQRVAADDFMELIGRNMDVSKNILSGAEWVFHEMTNNVLSHSGSKFGGLVQVSVHPSEQAITLVIADSGKGILGSMQEEFPRMRADLQAIGEAIKPGVSRAPKVCDGYGLARALGITTLTGGSFEITSGHGKVMAAADSEVKRKSLTPFYGGTAVCGQIKVNRSFSLSKALTFDTTD